MHSPRGRPDEERMGFLIEILLEFFGETLLQVVLQVFAEVGMHSVNGMRDPDRRRPVNPWLAGTGYLIFGVIVGGISLWFRPELFLASNTLRLLNLIATPAAAGLAMMGMGALRRRRDQPLIRLDRFAYGFIFAFGTSVTRYIVAG